MSIDFSDTGFEMEEPLVATTLNREDDNEVTLRPKTLADYVGQEKAKAVSYTHLTLPTIGG